MEQLHRVVMAGTTISAALIFAVLTGSAIGHMKNPKVHTFIHPVTSCEYIYTIGSDLVASEDGKGDHLGCRAPYMGNE